jgi:hypothetical protein
VRNQVLLATVAALASACAVNSSPEARVDDAAASSPAAPLAQAQPGTPAQPAWDMNATIIEACSCPMFCQCYFNAQPADHPGCCPADADPKTPPRYCRFNNAYRVNHGTYGTTKLDGAKFWVGGDLGGDFSKGEMTWAVLHFDPATTKEQREGIQAALGRLYPVKWGSFTIGKDYPIEWNGGKERSVATLDGGKAAEVVLLKNKGMTDEPIVMKNLKYWGAPRNDGFIMMQNEVEAYRATDKPFEFKRTNGFMITFDINSKDSSPDKKGY